MEGVAGCEEPWALSDGSNIEDIAWFCLNSAGEDAGHHPVKETIPNSFGLFDMHGNVWEWVEDDYSAYTGEITDPLANLHTNSKVVILGKSATFRRKRQLFTRQQKKRSGLSFGANRNPRVTDIDSFIVLFHNIPWLPIFV
jgi:formylglycine-generating enzyme required for sulfatase activity